MNRQSRISYVALATLLLTFGGCVGTDRTGSGTVHTRSQTRETPTTDGGKVVLEETWTDSTEESHSTSGFDPAMSAGLATVATVAGKVAVGDWQGAITAGLGGISVIAAAYAGNQRGKAVVQKQRADEHKADSDEAWSMLTPAQRAAVAQS